MRAASIPEALYVEDGRSAARRCARLGIPAGRDEHLQCWRDPAYAAALHPQPVAGGQVAGRDYVRGMGGQELPPPGPA